MPLPEIFKKQYRLPQMPKWLKWGLIFCIVYFGACFGMLVFISTISDGLGQAMLFSMLFLPALLIIIPLSSLQLELGVSGLFFVNIIIIFIFGAIVGGIIKRMKKKNMVN